VPNVGSRHNRGAAVDCTIADRDGQDLEMPSDYLVFDDRAHSDSTRMTPAARRNLRVLEKAMAEEGFTTIRDEWWHFDAPNWTQYRVMDVPFWPEKGDAGKHAAPEIPAPPDGEKSEPGGRRGDLGEEPPARGIVQALPSAREDERESSPAAAAKTRPQPARRGSPVPLAMRNPKSAALFAGCAMAVVGVAGIFVLRPARAPKRGRRRRR
jgi:hypothetical protein